MRVFPWGRGHSSTTHGWGNRIISSSWRTVFCVAADKTIKISAKRRRFRYVLYRFVCLTVLFTYFVSLSLVSLSLLYKCHLLIKCFIISPFFRSITCAFVSVPSRLPHMAPFCLIFSFLCLFFSNLPLPVRFLSHFLICVFSILSLFYFFVKIFPRPFAELSPVIVLFFFCLLCLCVCLFCFYSID